MKIQILSVSVNTKPTARGSYQEADIAFKNLSFAGKVEGRKIMSFGASADTFKVLSVAQPNDIFEVTVVKNDKGFNDWTSAARATEGSADAGGSINALAPKTIGGATRVSSFETPEERAKKQVYIIRQSSIASAIALLSANSKSSLDVDKVLSTATKLTDYVLGNDSPKNPAVDLNSLDIADMMDDLPQ